jgi:hypothetical protein
MGMRGKGGDVKRIGNQYNCSREPKIPLGIGLLLFKDRYNNFHGMTNLANNMDHPYGYFEPEYIIYQCHNPTQHLILHSPR